MPTLLELVRRLGEVNDSTITKVPPKDPKDFVKWIDQESQRISGLPEERSKKARDQLLMVCKVFDAMPQGFPEPTGIDAIYHERGLLGTVEAMERLRFLGYDYRRSCDRLYWKKVRSVDKKDKQLASQLFQELDQRKNEVLAVLELDDQIFGKKDSAILPRRRQSSVDQKKSLRDSPKGGVDEENDNQSELF